jgi:hypothetical protein
VRRVISIGLIVMMAMPLVAHCRRLGIALQRQGRPAGRASPISGPSRIRPSPATKDGKIPGSNSFLVWDGKLGDLS